MTLSLFLGVLLGGISGYFGGVVDQVIQRVIEILRSRADHPALDGPRRRRCRATGRVTQVYFAITIIISLIGWTELARVVRGRFLALREEDFITAAELDGCGWLRIIFRHMVPSFLSHIIAATTLALPVMIISETSLSFLGLGLRPPAISWGVLLQDGAEHPDARPGALAADRRRCRSSSWCWRSISSATDCATRPIRTGDAAMDAAVTPSNPAAAGARPATHVDHAGRGRARGGRRRA